jgi:1,4-dihydroxy-2-naphthoate octaprenyltransferase
MVGWLALGIAIPGIILSWVYTAPPLRLGYRGLGLGELSVLLSFGPIPALGAFYVLTHHVSALPVLASIPTGLLTAHVLISHDLLFYDPYKATGKVSLAVRLGRQATAKVLTVVSASAYVFVVALAAVGYFPITTLLVLLALPASVKLADFRGRVRSPPEYGSRTMLAFIQSIAFTGLLALGFLI